MPRARSNLPREPQAFAICFSVCERFAGKLIVGRAATRSDRGHEGAGGFCNTTTLFSVAAEDGTLEPVPLEPAAGGDDVPGPRGWLSFDSCKADAASNVCALFGGLAGDDAAPERLSDLWTASFAKA